MQHLVAREATDRIVPNVGLEELVDQRKPALEEPESPHGPVPVRPRVVVFGITVKVLVPDQDVLGQLELFRAGAPQPVGDRPPVVPYLIIFGIVLDCLLRKMVDVVEWGRGQLAFGAARERQSRRRRTEAEHVPSLQSLARR